MIFSGGLDLQAAVSHFHGAVMSEEAILRELSGEQARKHVEHITSQYPTRMAGTANGRRMAEYSSAAMNKSGVRAQVHELPGLVSFPETHNVRCAGTASWCRGR